MSDAVVGDRVDGEFGQAIHVWDGAESTTYIYHAHVRKFPLRMNCLSTESIKYF